MLFNEDLMEWAELAEQGTCMQRLQRIMFGYRMNNRNPITERLRDMVITSCSINCPQLQTATVEYHYVD
jgi:hypothetical protein